MNIAAKLAHKGIKWRFNPHSAPPQGGVWKRLVCSSESTLYRPRYVSPHRWLNTTFCLVEHALNSRSLTPLSAEPSNLGAITPKDFLIGNQATRIPSIAGVDEFDHRKRYARGQSYANTIRVRWLKEYVTALNRRSKWQTPAEQHFKVGDLVWIVEESNPRGYYLTAPIEELQ